jgi:hypothetical protein
MVDQVSGYTKIAEIGQGANLQPIYLILILNPGVAGWFTGSLTS